jgi:hypothetical protein
MGDGRPRTKLVSITETVVLGYKVAAELPAGRCFVLACVPSSTDHVPAEAGLQHQLVA